MDDRGFTVSYTPRETWDRDGKGRGRIILLPSLTLLSSGPFRGCWDGGTKALSVRRGGVVLNQTSGRFRGLDSCRVVSGLVVGEIVGFRELVAATGLARRHVRRPPAPVEGFKTLDEDCSSLFEPDICPDLWRSASTFRVIWDVAMLILLFATHIAIKAFEVV